MGLISGWGTKIPNAGQCGWKMRKRKKKKKKNTQNQKTSQEFLNSGMFLEQISPLGTTVV